MNGLNAFLLPSQIVIIRHAEKPKVGIELSDVGRMRSAKLPNYFDSQSILSEFGSPVAIYAATPNTEGDSLRSIQTVIPLAEHFKLKINQNFTKKNIHDLVEDILNNPLYSNRTVIICWDRSGIPTIARLFGAMDSPAIWNTDVYDRTWVIRFNKNQCPQFMDLAQRLMPFDNE